VMYTQSTAKSRVATTAPTIQRALARGCWGARGFFQPGGGVCLRGKNRDWLFAMSLAEGEFVRGFKRGSANAAEDRGAVAANQRVVHRFGAGRAPQIGDRRGLRWRWCCTYHSVSSVA
jgi:hypothetical protein